MTARKPRSNSATTPLTAADVRSAALSLYHYAWLRVRLAALEDAEELAAILADAWRQVAPRRLLAAHPELEEPGESGEG